MNRQSAKRGMRILLSGGLVVSSAAYAVWQHTVSAVLPRQHVQSIAAEPKKVAMAAPKPVMPSPAPSSKLALTEAPVKKSEDDVGPPPVTQPAANVPPPETPKTAPQGHAPYADGEYTGGVADTAWGDVQVKVVVRDGSVTKIEPLTYPDHRQRSIEINDWALPILEQEVVTVQTGRIDVVSQATVTSYGYQASLASALMQARVAAAQAQKP